MEAAPPSYENATLVDYWDIVAHYIPSNDLCSAALVCSRWHSTFTPHLWGNPASHFGIENDRVYVALTKFKRTLRTARLLVRSLTHTLHLPPAHAEIYNGPHADWLRDILERLPNLQSLIVRGLPFFDHSALQALKYKRPNESPGEGLPSGVLELPASVGFAFQRPADFIPSFGLRLLDASRCSNVTSSSLAQALGRFEGLLYLDLSFTYAARDPVVIKTFRRFSGLQVLKLRAISLLDDAVDVLGRSIARRVRSLDLRDNHLSDRGVRTLLNECFIVGGVDGNAMETAQRSPALLPYMGSDMLNIYQAEDFESFIRSAFTGRFVGRLAFEDAPEGGITHLYIGGNEISVEGVSGLLRSGRLHVLDAQAVQSGVGRHLSKSSKIDFDSRKTMPGVEKLTPLLSKYASHCITFLRMEHSLITKDSPNTHEEEIIQGRCELSDTPLPDYPCDAAELGVTAIQPEFSELPEAQTPKFELPGDPMQFVVSPAANDPQHRIEDDELPSNGPRRGGAFAPEVVDSLSAETDPRTLLSPVSALEENTVMNGSSTTTPVSPASSAPSPFSVSGPSNTAFRPRSYSSVADERRARLNAHMAKKHSLHPAMLPHLNTLVLTEVSPSSTDREISDRLIYFIRQCAEEAWLAKSQAKLDYALPPGRSGHAAALKQSADRIFALKRLVLELGHEQNTRRSSRASGWQHMSTKSMTEDRDSETLWSAAETDFSFFGEEDYSFPSLDSGSYAHSQRPSEKEVSFDNGEVSRKSNARTKPHEQPRFGTVALVSAFRKERKLAHQRSIAAGVVDPETEGYWEGIVQVVRPGSGLRADEEVDYYGNRFENGYLYR